MIDAGLSDHRLTWIVGCQVLMSSRAVRLALAPAGRARPLSDVMADVGSPLWRALGLTVDADPVRAREALVGRRLGLVPGAPFLAPPVLTGPRPVVVSPPAVRGTFGSIPLHSEAGERITEAVGLEDLSQLLWSFETLYLGAPDDSPVQLAQAASLLMPRLVGRVVVVLGRATGKALRQVAGVGEEMPLPGMLCTGELPHPSPTSFMWQDSAIRRRAMLAFSEAVRLARAELGVDDPDRCRHAFKRLAVGDPGGWRDLADLGVLASAGTPGLAWRACPSRRGVWRRRWVSVEGTVSGPPWTGRLGPDERRFQCHAEAICELDLAAQRAGLRELSAREAA